MKFSEGVECFLDFLREVESVLRISDATEQETNAKTQDLLHSLELENHTYHDYAAISKELVKIRQERRKAKDTIAVATLVCEWIESNKNTIKSLERLLGEVRKAETKQENRIYIPKARTREK